MWKKNYPLMLEAMARQREGVLFIAGDGPDAARLRQLAGPNVRFLGARDDIPALMNACDGFVLSSDVEGLPMVLLEAAASGLPQVATAAGGVAEAVIHERTGYRRPDRRRRRARRGHGASGRDAARSTRRHGARGAGARRRAIRPRRGDFRNGRISTAS